MVGLLSSAPALVAQQPATLRKYDVRFLTAREAEMLPAQRTTPDVSTTDIPSSGAVLDPVAALEPADLMALLEQECEVASGNGAAQLEFTDSGILLVTADAKTHDRIAALVAQCRAYFLEQVVLEMHVLPGSALAGGTGVLKRDEAEGLLSSSAPHPVFVCPARVGGSQVLQSNRDQAYVRDYDVEVAQGSNIPDPKVDVLRLGSGWQVRLEHGHDGRLLVQVHGDRAEQDADPVPYPVRSRDVKNQEVISLLQLSRTRITQQWTQAMLGDGEALLWGSNSQPGAAWCLRVRRPKAVAPPSGIGWTMLPVRSLCVGLPEWGRFHFPVLASPGDDAPLVAEAQESPPRLLDKDKLMADLRQCLRGEASRSIDYGAGVLIVRAPEPELQAVRERLALLSADAARDVSIEVRYGYLDANEVAVLLNPRTDMGEIAGRLHDACLTASLLDGWFACRVGKEASIVRDYDVEIAQDSSVPNPLIGTVFTGMTLRGQVLPVAEGQFRLELDAGFAELDGAIEAFDTKDTRFGDIALPRLRNVHFDVAPIVEDNRWTLLHIASMPGNDQHLVVVARVRE
ncbi:MAG TPA: hypothetical protein VFZ65_16230 [Planctomycetota bacterium]|nr:hypothetical protein [Planctomycetota bacterium]